MAIDLNAPLDRLIVLIKTISGLADSDGTAHVWKGVPGSLPTRASAYVALGDLVVSERTTQQQQIEAAYFVGFGYRIDPDAPATSVAAAETAICTNLAAFIGLMKQATNRTLNNGTTDLVRDARLEFPLAGAPQYQPLAGQEHRVLPVLVRTTLVDTY